MILLWVDEWCNKASRSSIDVDWAVNASLNKQVVDGLGILILSGESRTQDGANTYEPGS